MPFSDEWARAVSKRADLIVVKSQSVESAINAISCLNIYRDQVDHGSEYAVQEFALLVVDTYGLVSNYRDAYLIYNIFKFRE